jgi:antitoxin YobK
MSNKEFEEAKRIIGLNSHLANFAGPKSESLILKAEMALGLTFPASYRQFLREFGCGSIAGAEFYGVIDDDFVNSSVPDAVWLTLDERRASNAPATLVLIGSTGDGGYFGLDCAAENGFGEFPVIEWWNDEGEQVLVANNFGEYFLQTISDLLPK